jgi:hypothetical protein
VKAEAMFFGGADGAGAWLNPAMQNSRKHAITGKPMRPSEPGKNLLETPVTFCSIPSATTRPACRAPLERT